nr:methionyl-tRNA formyltransferase [Maliibacterium massiliense]
MRLCMLGTPEFAVPVLQKLATAGHDVAAVVTQPDRPRGRGKKLSPPPAKEAARALGIAVLQFARIRDAEAVQALRDLACDAFVTAAYGQILSQEILDIPPLGVINVHASLLPAYRGAAPVPWCLAAGEKVTGVTTMFTDAGVDTGDIILQKQVDILPEENAGELLARLSHVGADLLVETLGRIAVGDCPRTPQDHARATRVPMLQKADGKIDFACSADQLHDLVRGMNPWPVAWTLLAGAPLKVYKTALCAGTGAPGEVLVADAKAGLRVACGQGALEIVELQVAGGRRMTAKEYLRAHSIARGAYLGDGA